MRLGTASPKERGDQEDWGQGAKGERQVAVPAVRLANPADGTSDCQGTEGERDGHLEDQEKLGHLAEDSLNEDISTTRRLRMKWVTRQNASVDRIACPWLVKRFIAPDAEFLYVPAAEGLGAAESEGGLPH